MLKSDKDKALIIKRGLKKDIFINIVLLVAALIIYLYLGANWIFWVILIIAIGNLIVVFFLKRLMSKAIREKDEKRV